MKFEKNSWRKTTTTYKFGKPAKNQVFLKCLDKDDNLSKYSAIKSELDAIYDHITEGIRIWSKCKWYEHSEKSSKFF